MDSNQILKKNGKKKQECFGFSGGIKLLAMKQSKTKKRELNANLADMCFGHSRGKIKIHCAHTEL